MRWLQEGDANSRLFHAFANGRRTKNHIGAIQVGRDLITDKGQKEACFFEAYNKLLGEIQVRDNTLDLDKLELPILDLQDVDAIFTEEEVWGVIREFIRLQALMGVSGLSFRKLGR
jgi:hypothetical protein